MELAATRMTPTYDDRQLSARLVVCARCQRAYYFTDHARTLCLVCERAAPRVQA